MNITEQIKRDEIRQGWGAAYPVWARLLNERGLRVGVEIGVGYGGNAEYMLKHTGIEKLYGVDPWPGWHFAPQQLYQYVCERLAPYGDRYQHIFKCRLACLDEIPNELDFVYVDAFHDHQSVLADLGAYVPKLRVGGVIGGDGYYHGVKSATDEFFGRLGWDVIADEHTVWWVEKGQC